MCHHKREDLAPGDPLGRGAGRRGGDRGWLRRWAVQQRCSQVFRQHDPGVILVGAQREYCRRWRNQREVTVKGIHFIQEDSPAQIGQAIAEWYVSL